MNSIPLNILVISDRNSDIETLKQSIRNFAPQSLFVVAKNYNSLRKKANWLDYHLIICDHQLKACQAQKANIRLRIQLPHVPFILISDCPEIHKDQFSKNSSGWNIRAVISRDQLTRADTVLKSVFNNHAANLEMERAHQIRSRQRSLLLQKFECSMQKTLLPLDTLRIDELFAGLFSKQKPAKGITTI